VAIEGESSRAILDKGRMEAFSDGVLAFAITLLVIDIAVRPPGSPSQEFFHAWPSYLAYLVSFFTIGAAWTPLMLQRSACRSSQSDCPPCHRLLHAPTVIHERRHGPHWPTSGPRGWRRRMAHASVAVAYRSDQFFVALGTVARESSARRGHGIPEGATALWHSDNHRLGPPISGRSPQSQVMPRDHR